MLYWFHQPGVSIMNAKSVWMVLAACSGLGIGSAALSREAPGVVDSGPPACLAPAAWAVPDTATPRPDRAPAVFAAMASRDVVLLGEQHDDADHHRWQLQTLAALHAQRPDMVIGFEMFPRRLQPVLDRWVAGDLSEARFLEQAEWDTVWTMPAELYLPLFQFARLNRIPMVALNVDQQLIRAISAHGWAAIPAAEREGVGSAAEPAAAYLDFLFAIHSEHVDMRGKGAAKPRRSDAAFRNFVDAQLLWDRAMAEALARPLTNPARDGAERPLVVGIMGSGHIRFGHGVPHQLRALGVPRIGTLLPLSAATPCTEIPAGLADAVFAVPDQPAVPPPPPRLGIGLDAHRDGVRVAEVTAGGLADTTGLRINDLIVEVAGTPAHKVTALVASIRGQPAGTWLPLKVRRGAETLELVIKFPAKS